MRQHPLVLPSGEVIHLDLAWPDVRLAVEPGHSWWHGGDLRQRRDQDRDRACAVVGWHVVRYDESAARDRRRHRQGAAGPPPPPDGRPRRFSGVPLPLSGSEERQKPQTAAVIRAAK